MADAVCRGAGVHCCPATRSSHRQRRVEGSECGTGRQPAGGNTMTWPSFLSEVFSLLGSLLVAARA